MAHKNIIVIGASYGGIQAIKTLVSGLPKELPASILVVQHNSTRSPGVLPEIFMKAGPLPASYPAKSERLRPGQIYVAPPDYHMLLEQGTIRLTRGPKENRFRPAIDALFRSAAYAYGSRVVGVVLTGLLDDGTAGLWAVKDRGGTTIVQDPREAAAPSMPQSALEHVAVDHCLPLSEIAPLLVQLAHTPAPTQQAYPMPERMGIEVEIAREAKAIEHGILQLGTPSRFTCPECHGVLLQLNEGRFLRFRCHTGHAYSAASLMEDSEEVVEEALWTSIRTLDERPLLLQQLAQDLKSRNRDQEAEQMLQKAENIQRQSDLVRSALTPTR
ncbi:MAG TPA: chemotaxis protein CheB [Blastocatellia bacterium]|nr:chemotaxis protein CheB [Blastocatellia bacterium]